MHAWLADVIGTTAGVLTTAAFVPQVARTRAWAMRELTTQLASWTQLRHDTILYVKQSYTSGAGCFYPAGYVDPRPVFWARFETMARRTARLLSKTPYPRRQIGPVDLQALKKRHVAFFTNFAEKLALIHGIAVKQMAQKPLDASQSRILKDVVQIHHGSGFTRYDGWYPTLFYGGAMDCGKADPIVADVHTDVPAPILGDPGGVLHQGVGRVDLMMVAIDNGKDKMVYAGPVSSHYEFILDGVKRKSDSEWKKELQSGKTPPRPSWTREYLVP